MDFRGPHGKKRAPENFTDGHETQWTCLSCEGAEKKSEGSIPEIQQDVGHFWECPDLYFPNT